MRILWVKMGGLWPATTGGRVRISRDTAAWDVDVKWLTGEVRLSRAAGG